MSLDDWVAPKIRMSDILCRCGKPDCTHNHYGPLEHPRTRVLLRKVGALLQEYDLPFRITSGFRCGAWNQQQGGAKNSAHVHRCAVDVSLSAAPYEFALMCEAAGWFSGLLVYPWGVHLDIHPSDGVVRGHSYGPGNNRFMPYGNRWNMNLPRVYEWNLDCSVKPPDYIAEILLREGVEM